MNKSRIIIVDDHPIVLRGLADLIALEPDLEVAATFETASAASEWLRNDRPDMAIIDLSLKVGSGLKLLKMISKSYPAVKLLVLTMHDERLYANRAFKAGASGYVNKESASEEIVCAIRTLLNGQEYGGDHIHAPGHSTSGGIGAAKSVEDLTDRELEIFILLGQGLGARQIAEKIVRSVKTVETHLDNIKKKLDISNGKELTHSAVRWVFEQEERVS